MYDYIFYHTLMMSECMDLILHRNFNKKECSWQKEQLYFFMAELFSFGKEVLTIL